MTHVLLTVGLNEIPVLVAAYRLCRHYWTLDKCLPRFSVLCSEESREEADRVRRELVRKLSHDTNRLIADQRELDWKERRVHPYRPGQIRQKVEEILAERPLPTRFHLNYTGGSKAMGVHAIEALVRGHYPFEMSYVDPEEYRLYDGNDAIIDAVEDERRHWRLSGVKLAELHGFKAEFRPPPTEELIRLGRQLFEILRDRVASGTLRDWLKKTPRNCPPQWPAMTHPDWPAVRAGIDRQFPDADAWKWRTARGWTFLDGRALELHAFGTAVDALAELAEPHAISKHFNVTCHRVDPSVGPPFELDVVLISGFELVAVSCSLSNVREIKHKGFEVAHRARQIGGSNARCIFVCMENDAESRRLQEELRDDLGGRDKNVEVWGAAEVDRLKEVFQDYLIGIGWGKRT